MNFDAEASQLASHADRCTSSKFTAVLISANSRLELAHRDPS